MTTPTDDTARKIHTAWLDGATFDDLAGLHGLDRAEVRRIVLAEQIAHPSAPGTDLVRAAAPPAEAEGGELVVQAVRYLPARYHGDGPPPPGSPQHVIDTWLPESAKRLILRGKSEHTVRGYLAAFGWWTKFARANRITILPAPQNGMIRMLDSWELLPVHVGCSGRRQADGSECTGHRPSPSAVWLWFSAMKWFHGLGQPPIPWEGGVMLSDAIAGYIRQIKDDGWRRTSAPRAYPDELRAMINVLDRMPAQPPADTPEEVEGQDEVDDRPVWLAPARVDMLRALILCAYYTGGRASDVARYRIHDVQRFPGGMDLLLARSKASKGDRNEEHRTIHSRAGEPGYDPHYDGTVAIERWLARLAAAGIRQGAMFRPVHKSGAIVRGAPDELSYRADVTGLSRCVRVVAKAAWLASGRTLLRDWRKVTIHSLRRARVQDLLEAGADVWDVETELGWAHGGAIKFYRAEVERRSSTAANAMAML